MDHGISSSGMDYGPWSRILVLWIVAKEARVVPDMGINDDNLAGILHLVFLGILSNLFSFCLIFYG